MDAEITAHEQLINTVMSTADQLIEREHYAADEIEARCADLQEKWAELTSLSAIRQQNLQESQKAQQVRKKTVQGLERACACAELLSYCPVELFYIELQVLLRVLVLVAPTTSTRTNRGGGKI